MRDEIVDYIYTERYRLALRYNMTEVCEEHGIRPEVLKRELRERYDLDYSEFRRDALRWYVFITRQHFKASDVMRSLGISRNTLYRLYGEVGIHYGHGGDRQSEHFKRGGYG